MMPGESFKDIQKRFTDHIRDPQHRPLPNDIEDRRMNIYRDLFFNNINNFVSSAFPVLKSLYSDDDWTALVRSFFIHHQCHSPIFTEISKEFVHYLNEEHEPTSADPSFQKELAHYEWIEIDVSTNMVNIEETEYDENGNLLENTPVLNPVLVFNHYEWPVHTISRDHMPKAKETTFIVVYRNKEHAVRFTALNPVSARLLEKLQTQPDASGMTLLNEIAEEIEHPNPNVVIQGGTQTLMQFKQTEIILGTR